VLEEKRNPAAKKETVAYKLRQVRGHEKKPRSGGKGGGRLGAE